MPAVPPAPARIYAPLTDSERAAAPPPAPAPCDHDHSPPAETETCC